LRFDARRRRLAATARMQRAQPDDHGETLQRSTHRTTA